jgi:iron(III) transport system permease protein
MAQATFPSDLRWRASRLLWQGRPPSPAQLAAATLVAAFMAMPLVYVLYRGLGSGTGTWSRLWDTRIPELLQNTIELTLAVSLLTAIVGGGLAWVVVRTDVPLRGLWSWLLAVPLVVPRWRVRLRGDPRAARLAV